jgi:hypothetical protein
MISQKYNINVEELKVLWEGGNVVHSVPVIPFSASKELEILTRSQLVEMCKSKNLKVSGNKTELISRILEHECKPSVTNSIPLQHTSQPPQIIKKLVEKIPKLEIKRNSDGYFVHTETSFVFDTKSQKVYGKLIDNKLEELTVDDIDICNKYKFSYILPNNLDKKINILDVKVDELDDVELELEDELDDEYNDDEEEIELEEDEYYEE